MKRSLHRRSVQALAFAAALLAVPPSVHSQAAPSVTARQAREASDAYMAGARLLRDNKPAEAETSFARAVTLDSTRSEYELALTIARQHHVAQLVQDGAKQRLMGHTDQADKLFAQAQALDPDNAIVAEHMQQPSLAALQHDGPALPVGAEDIARLGGPIRLAPTAGLKSFHTRGDTQSMLREVYNAFGIQVTFDESVTSQLARMDLQDVTFAEASRIALRLAHIFATPLSATSVMLAKDTPENRDRLSAKIEETVYLPGVPIDQLNELSNVAKNVFDIKQVTVSQSAQTLLLRGDDDALQLVNGTFASLLDGGDDVMLDVKLYEVDKNFMRNIGADLPTSAGVISVAGAAQSIISQNQSLLTQLEALDPTLATAGVLAQAAALLAAGATSSVLSGILGTVGTFGGVPLAGVFLGSSTTFNAQLTSSDVRVLDSIQIRVGEKQTGTFRVGSRYPITTSQFSSGISSSLASQIKGVTINGQSAASLLSSLTSASVPIFQYEDLGLTLKATPQVQKSGNVAVHIDMKIEALGGGSINNIPILNSRQITSDIIVPEGNTAMLGSAVTSQESRAIQGIPLLNEIPGLAGTDQDREHDTSDLLITVTPHVVRRRSPVLATRRVLANLAPVPE